MKLLIVFGFLVLAASAASVSSNEPFYLASAELDYLLNDPLLRRTHLEVAETFGRLTNASSMASPNFFFDQSLTAQISVGNPPKTFRVAVESGTTKMFLFDWGYPGKWRDERYYDPAKSSTSKNQQKNFFSRTGGIEVSGKTYKDLVTLGSDFEQDFGVVTQMDFPGSFPEHGVLGVGWLTNEQKERNPEASPVINALLGEKEGNHKFVLVLREHSAPMLIWGPIRLRTNHPIPFHSLGSGDDRIPVIKLQSFRVKNYENTIEAFASLDTGFSVIALPPKIWYSLVSLVKVKFDSTLGAYTVDCGPDSVRQPTLYFKLNGIEYSVRHTHYLLDRDFPNDVCIFAVTKSNENLYHLGMPFLRTAAAVFDLDSDSVSLAPYRWDMEDPQPRPRE